MDKQVSLKKVLAVVGVVIVLGGTFYSGMLFENHRITKGFEEAFEGFGDEDSALDGDIEGSSEEAEEVPEPTELTEGQTVTYSGENYDGQDEERSVTLVKVSLSVRELDEDSDDPDLTRYLQFDLKVQNTGDSVVSDPSFQGHFESEDGKVYDFSGVTCDDNDMPTDELDPGKYVEGCNEAAIPEGAGKFVFDSAPYYISVPA